MEIHRVARFLRGMRKEKEREEKRNLLGVRIMIAMTMKETMVAMTRNAMQIPFQFLSSSSATRSCTGWRYTSFKTKKRNVERNEKVFVIRSILVTTKEHVSLLDYFWEFKSQELQGKRCQVQVPRGWEPDTTLLFFQSCIFSNIVIDLSLIPIELMIVILCIVQFSR